MYALALVSAGILLLATASQAFAAGSAVYSGVSFGPDGTASSSFSGVRSVTVDQATEDVYVYDAGAGRVYKFDAAGHPVNFSGLGTNFIEGAGGSAGGAEFQIAVAPAGAPAGTEGDIYVANLGSALKVFAPDGSELAELVTGGETCGVAVDPEGHVFAGVYPNVVEYTPTTNPPTAADQTGISTAPGGLLETCNVGADGLHNIYSASYRGWVSRLEGLGDPTPTRVDSSASSVAVDPFANVLYADRGTEIVKYSSTGQQLASFGGSGDGAISGSFGLGVNGTSGQPSSGDVYVYDGASSQVEIFSPIVVPDVTIGPVAGITPSGATFQGAISAAGGSPATCTFQYVAAAVFAESGFESALAAPCSPTGPFTGSGSVAVEASVGGLLAGTEYQVRLVGESAEGANHSDTTFKTPGGEGQLGNEPGPCLNDALRMGFGSALPDCRAYEQVSPTDKGGNSVGGSSQITKASPSGDAVTYYSQGGIPGMSGDAGSQSFPSYLARRGADAWGSQGLLPPPAYGSKAAVIGYSKNLEYVVTAAERPGVGVGLFIENTRGGSQPVTIVPNTAGGRTVQNYALDSISANGNIVFFESTLNLTGSTIAGEDNLYVWNRGTGTFALAGVLPGPTASPPPGGAFGGPYNWLEEPPTPEAGGAMKRLYVSEANAATESGGQIYFTAAGGQIYLRRGLTGSSPSTVPVSVSQKTNGSGPGGTDPYGPQPAAFIQATRDGSKAFFLSSEELTNNATTGTEDQGKDLYMYDAGSGKLTDLTPDPTDPKGAEVEGVLGMSQDGSSIYFVAGGALSPGAGRTSCEFELCNLYRLQLGAGGGATITFLTRLAGGEFSSVGSDARDWSPGFTRSNGGEYSRRARVTDDGSTLLFASVRSLTGYDNRSAACSGRCPELFRYSAAGGGLNCISCSPVGGAPLGEPILSNQSINSSIRADGIHPAILPRNLSANGKRIIFQTPDPLVRGDTNGAAGCSQLVPGRPESRSCEDVYEWEAPGEGSCHEALADGGCLSLLSTGQSSQPSFFADADETGENVFIVTLSQLVPVDKDQLYDLYDVREEGGLASQSQLPAVPCSGEECQGAATPAPAISGAASMEVNGPGNRKAKPKNAKCHGKGKKCKKKHPHKHHRKHPKGKAKKRTAKTKAGGAK